MSWFIHHCGEHANRTYAEVYERDFPPGVELGPRRYGPYETKEEALEAAKKKGLSTTSLRDVNKLIWL
jgi:hypothetical protein